MSIKFAEPVTLKETLGAAQLLIGQIGEDKIARSLEVSKGLIATSLPPYYYNSPIEAHATIIEQASKILDSPKTSPRKYFHRAKSKRLPATDAATLHGKIGNISVQITYLVAHEHKDYRGEVRNDKPRWRCGSCRDLLTITESRALGLLPPLVRKRSTFIPF